jgi:hypothetical protein
MKRCEWQESFELFTAADADGALAPDDFEALSELVGRARRSGANELPNDPLGDLPHPDHLFAQGNELVVTVHSVDATPLPHGVVDGLPFGAVFGERLRGQVALLTVEPHVVLAIEGVFAVLDS